jgi:hypothetical protein
MPSYSGSIAPFGTEPWATRHRSPEAGATPERSHRKRGTGTRRTTLSLDPQAASALARLSEHWRLSKAGVVSLLLSQADDGGVRPASPWRCFQGAGRPPPVGRQAAVGA